MKQNEINNLPKLSSFRYENFLNLYKDNTGYFYNLLRAINIISSNNQDIEEVYPIKPSDTWASLSHKFYKTIDLWWLICTYNQIVDASTMPETGTIIKILKPEYVGYVLQQLLDQTWR